jgi:hypothetical protein
MRACDAPAWKAREVQIATQPAQPHLAHRASQLRNEDKCTYPFNPTFSAISTRSDLRCPRSQALVFPDIFGGDAPFADNDDDIAALRDEEFRVSECAQRYAMAF